ncbi:hypothetical protein [Mycobacterium cookii]|nr:hypothetical protein [Mycobacterium cookii]MCV7329067.1 hypothetical protein [Mycobacterium cookii]
MTRWLRANGGPLGLGVVLLSLGTGLVFQQGLVRVAGWLLLAGAVISFILSSESIQRRIPWMVVSRKELSAEFWERAFEALPFPAFIKEFPHDSHLKGNNALTRFQGKKPSEELAGVDLAALIQQDHRLGDRLAEHEGFSVQLELTDKVTTLKPRAILTLKSCIEYEGQKYIIGSYVPVTLPADLPSGTSFEAAECGGQILFQCPATTVDGNYLVVTLGKSIRGPQAESKE